MTKKKTIAVLGIVLVLALLAGCAPAVTPPVEPTVIEGTQLSAETSNTYKFLNPLGTVEPRQDTPLADRQPVIDILNATGERTLRLGVAWYYKPLDAEPPYAIAEMLKEKWEADYPGLTVELVIPDPKAAGIGSELPDDPQYIPAVGHAWNNRPDIVYDTWAENVDAMCFGVGD